MRAVQHPNVVDLRAYFYSKGDKDEVYLNLVLECMPETLYAATRFYAKQKQSMPMVYVKVYMYQLMRALAYIHTLGICHRDIKPQNIIVDPASGMLKLIDFGSAKVITVGQPNVSYIASRYYRAPEAIFGATDYTVAIDIWAAGCTVAELMLGQPPFLGESGVDQLVEIIKVLGTPTKEEVKTMNPKYVDYKVRARSLATFAAHASQLHELTTGPLAVPLDQGDSLLKGLPSADAGRRGRLHFQATHLPACEPADSD